MFAEPTNADLLANCKRQALTQNRLQAHSPVGSMNLGWAATEAGEFKAAHNWYEESVRRADAEENDVLRATGRIELAGSKLFGFGPDAYAEFAARGGKAEPHTQSRTHIAVDLISTRKRSQNQFILVVVRWTDTHSHQHPACGYWESTNSLTH